MEGPPLRTACFDEHVACGGNMVDFHGFELPIWYTNIKDEHLATRSGAGLFDGAWGAYPYFNSNRIIVSDRSNGLFVIEFTEENWTIPFQMGDINTDAVVDISDIIMIVAYIIDETPFTESEQFVADMNMDGIINILDIMTMVYFILHR